MPYISRRRDSMWHVIFHAALQFEEDCWLTPLFFSIWFISNTPMLKSPLKGLSQPIKGKWVMQFFFIFWPMKHCQFITWATFINAWCFMSGEWILQSRSSSPGRKKSFNVAKFLNYLSFYSTVVLCFPVHVLDSHPISSADLSLFTVCTMEEACKPGTTNQRNQTTKGLLESQDLYQVISWVKFVFCHWIIHSFKTEKEIDPCHFNDLEFLW